MENNNSMEEKLYFPTKKLWTESESSEDKNKKALIFLLDKLTATVPNKNLSPILFRLLNIMFFKKIK